MMALLLLSPSPSYVSSPSSLSLSITAFPNESIVGILEAIFPVSRLHRKCFDLQSKSCIGIQICTPFGVQERGAVIVRASSDSDGIGSGGAEPPAEKKEEIMPVENLPLESKLQLKLEQKLRMKLAKKIRLRRKRLVRKRHLRKKGRWPPSKMKKNKNV